MESTESTTLPGIGIFLGEKEVASFVDKEEMKEITFVDGTTTLLHSEIYDIIKDDKESEFLFDELVANYCARTFLKELTRYNLRGFQVKTVADYMYNLSYNSHVAATEKLWGKEDSQIRLQDIEEVLNKK